MRGFHSGEIILTVKVLILFILILSLLIRVHLFTEFYINLQI